MKKIIDFVVHILLTLFLILMSFAVFHKWQEDQYVKDAVHQNQEKILYDQKVLKYLMEKNN